MTTTPALNKAHNHTFRAGVLTIHYTESPHGTPPRKVKTICGQSHRRTYFGVMSDHPDNAAFTVNCTKCLTVAAK
ncbi:hypothetical protein [Saccharopolyspora taberi]|uniref:N-acetylmuramoyl-L-alanine amidase n=1 Tax=Saccharopolyspora taberi TaxID=60895 RepID=A0ABN3V0K8_9PSEU